jgi:hypothetical protein
MHWTDIAQRRAGAGRTQELLDTTNIGTVIESFASETEALEPF